MNGSESSSALEQEGLQAIGAHIRLEDLSSRLTGIIDDAKVLGVHQLGIAWIRPTTADPAAPLSAADVDSVANVINAACKPLHAAGLQLYVHTHGFEFAVVDGKTMLDRLLASVSSECLGLQIDVFWAASAGVDPARLIEQYRQRLISIHLKDRRRGAVSPTPWSADVSDFVVLGKGSLDIAAILALAKHPPTPYLIIEDESADPARNIQKSLQFLATFH